MAELRSEGRLQLTPTKVGAIVDCTATAPENFQKAYPNGKANQKAWSDAGFLGSTGYCMDHKRVMASFKITAFEDLEYQKWFESMIPVCATEMFASSNIREPFYDNLGFPVDEDSNGNKYLLTTDNMIRRRSCPMYHIRNIEKIKLGAETAMQQLENARLLRIKKAEDTIADAHTCERLLLGLLDLPRDADTTVVFEGATYEHLEKRNVTATLIESFIRSRMLKDASAELKLPKKKGKAEAIRSGTDTAVLIKLAHDIRTKPFIATVPEVPPVEPPRITIPPPSVVKFMNEGHLIESNLKAEWCERAFRAVASLKDKRDVLDHHIHVSGIHELQEHANLLVRRLYDRLPFHLNGKIDEDREDLLPGNHWLWRSYGSKMAQACVLMILSEHIPDMEQLKSRGKLESLLKPPSAFEKVDDESKAWNGNYLVHDTSRNMIIRSGAASVGFQPRWDQHVQASKLTVERNCHSDFYMTYPHRDSTYRTPMKRGHFQDLTQVVGIGFDREKAPEIVDLFEWSDYEIRELKKLSAGDGRDTLLERQFRHIVYLVETLYGLAIDLKINISGNPGSEWQLRYYGKSRH